MTDEAFLQEYAKLAHALQTAVLLKIAADYPSVNANRSDIWNYAKHLRVGVDTQKSDLGAVARLLVKKGIISDDEYKEAILEGLRREKEMHETELGPGWHLG